MTTRIIAVLFFTLATSISAFSDEAFDFFVETCRHSGFNPTEISTFQAEFKVITQRIYRDPDSAMEEHIRWGDIALTKSNMDEVQKQKSIEGREESLKRFFSNEPMTKFVKASLKNTAAHLGLEDILGEFIEVEKTEDDTQQTYLSQVGTGTYKISSDGTPIPVGIKERIGMSQRDVDSATVIMDTNIRNSGNYHLGGRSRSIMTASALEILLTRDDRGVFSISDTGIAAWEKECEKYETTFTLSKERVKYDGDHFAYILEVYDKGQLCARLWVDPDRGYICPRDQRIESSVVKREVVAENFIFDEHSQKWFPQKVVRSSWGREESDVKETHTEIHLMPGTLSLNRPIPDSVFTLTVPKNARVDDTRRDDNDKSVFFANQPGELDLSTVEEKKLDELEWLSTRPVKQYYPLPIEKTSFKWINIVGIVVGIIMIIIALYGLSRKER